MSTIALPSDTSRGGSRSERSTLCRAFCLAIGIIAAGGAGHAAAAEVEADGVETAPVADGGAAADAEAPAAEPVVPSEPSPPEGKYAPAEAAVVEAIREMNVQELSSLDLEALLQNTVVAATKSEQLEDEAPAIITVISREEIQRWGYQSVEEALQHVAGVYMVNDHIIPNVGVRGISGGLRSESGLIKVMIDGRSVAFRSTAGNWLGSELVPLSVVQQIEIIRGPASSLYGADAFLGVINIVTRRAELMQGGEIGMAGNREGGYGYSRDTALGMAVGNWRILASMRTNSEDRSGLILPSSSPNPRLSTYAPADRKANDLTLDSSVALARVSYLLGRRGSIALTGYMSSIDRGAEFADWAQLTHHLDSSGRPNGTKISLRQGTAGLDLDLRLTRTVDLRAYGLFFAGGPTSKDRIDVNSESYYVKRDFSYMGFDAGAEAAWRPLDTLSVLVGGGMILDHEKLPTVYDVLKTSLGTLPGERAGDQIPTSAVAGNKNLSNVGANALVMWSPLSRLTLTGGARYDYHSVYGGKLSGRLAGVVALQRNLHLKLLYGSAFKAPSPQLLYGSPLAPGDITGNVNLKPSYVHTIESQLAYRANRYLHVTTGVAYSYLLDQATFAQRGINQVALNISRVASISWETEVRADYKRKLSAYGNFTFNRTLHSLTQSNYVANLSNYANAAYPAIVGNLGASGEVPWLPLRLSAEMSYVSSRRSSSANTLEAGQWYTLDAYFLFGATVRTVGIHLLPQKETILMLVARNLANTRYSDPGFAGIDYPQLGRTFLLQAIQEF